MLNKLSDEAEAAAFPSPLTGPWTQPAFTERTPSTTSDSCSHRTAGARPLRPPHSSRCATRRRGGAIERWPAHACDRRADGRVQRGTLFAPRRLNRLTVSASRRWAGRVDDRSRREVGVQEVAVGDDAVLEACDLLGRERRPGERVVEVEGAEDVRRCSACAGGGRTSRMRRSRRARVGPVRTRPRTRSAPRSPALGARRGNGSVRFAPSASTRPGSESAINESVIICRRARVEVRCSATRRRRRRRPPASGRPSTSFQPTGTPT